MGVSLRWFTISDWWDGSHGGGGLTEGLAGEWRGLTEGLAGEAGAVCSISVASRCLALGYILSSLSCA